MKLLQFHFNVPNLATFVIGRAKNKDLLNQIDDFGKTCGTSFFNEITNCWGGLTKTNVIYHGSQNTGNLIVVEQKTKRGFAKPFVVTVAHYYAYIKNSFISPKKYEVGLSMEVDIKVLNNNLDVTIKGPYEHLSLELLQMFKEVSRTKIWIWTMRPYETHSRLYNTDHDEYEQKVATETENDDEGIKGNNEQQSSRAKGSFSRRDINNDGTFNGNGCGNMIQGDFNQFTIYRK
ncbi:uncharacterized protein LOC131636656 isoform X2 [Vicia villosa]|nr:uncharacterized protein LOC131636656 isoform X2 [Vicia villosa]